MNIENEKIRVRYILLAIYFSFGSLQFISIAGIGVVRFLNIFILLAFFIPIVNRKENLKVNNKWVMLIIFIIYLCLTIFWSKNPIRVLNSCIMYILIFSTYLIVTNQKCNQKEEKVMMLIIIIFTTLISSLITFNVSTYDIAGRKTLFLFGKNADPNFLSINIIFSIICTINLIIKKYYSKVLLIISIIIQIISIVKMGSRNALVCLIIAILVYFIFLSVNDIKSVKNLIIISIISIIVIYIGINNLPDNIIERLNLKEAIEGGANGRFEIWIRALKMLFNSIGRVIFGFGAGQMPVLIEYAHNFYIELLFEYGVIGLGIMFLFLVKVASLCKKDPFKNSLLVYILISSMTLSTDRATIFWNIMIIISIWETRSIKNVEKKI